MEDFALKLEDWNELMFHTNGDVARDTELYLFY